MTEQALPEQSDSRRRTLTPADGASYSRLAWELAQHAYFDNPAGTVSATIYPAGGGSIAGFGVTSTLAMRALAMELDRWSREAGSVIVLRDSRS